MSVEIGPVVCSACNMWEIRDIVHVPGDYICRKCVQLQLLSDHIERLELRLDSYWSIHDAEKLVNSTYSELVTPQVNVKRTERNGWPLASVAVGR